MYILKNAWVSIKEHKGRNLLIGIIVVVIACSVAVSLAILNSANKLIDSYENKYDVTATIGVNRENMKNGLKQDDSSEEKKSLDDMKDVFSEISNITTSQIEKYGKSSYVKSYYYTLSTGVNSSDIEKASNTKDNNSNNKDEKNSGNDMNRDNRGGGPEGFKNQTFGDFTLTGYSSVSAMEDFISGKYKITSGEISTDLNSNTCVINSELATLNNINVGDKITLTDPEKESNTITLEVTGIYEEKDSSDEGMGMFTNSANNIITNTSVLEKISSSDSNLKVSTTPTFVLKDKNDIEKFEKELHKKGLSTYLTLNTNLDQVESATSSISNVKTFAVTFLVITLVIGGIVLFVINLLNIRERKYEIGVLRAIGMKKRLITTQFVLELLIVVFASLIIGTGIGSVMSVPVSNNLLESEINSSKEEQQQIGNNFGPGRNMGKINGVNSIEAFDSIDAVVDIKVIGELLIVGVVLTLVSSSASMISVQRFSPLEILRERS